MASSDDSGVFVDSDGAGLVGAGAAEFVDLAAGGTDVAVSTGTAVAAGVTVGRIDIRVSVDVDVTFRPLRTIGTSGWAAGEGWAGT